MLTSRVVLRTFLRTKATRTLKRREIIPIQLLKDIENVGVAGEILNVKAGYMRNFLHRDNKACYITENQGPRIPVVESTKKEDIKKKKSTLIVDEVVQVQDTPTPLSLEELSSIFSTMRKSTKPATVAANVETSGSESSFSLVELEENIPATFAHQASSFPVSKEVLSQAIFNSTGIEVPVSAIKIRNNAGDLQDEIAQAGVYTWIFQNQGNSRTLKRALRVQ